MNELATYSSYIEFKQALDTEMLRTAEGFVRIGYLLKMAEETNILQESGYGNVNEFAKAEYGIDASQVSRFINIHERFGVPGEMRLQDRYASHGVAKLGIMLTLPDEINEEISADYSKSEINQIKAEIDAEKKISDLEVMMEEKDPVQQSLQEGLKQVVYQLIHDYPDIYERMYKAIDLDDLKETMAPNGECTYTIRIPGTGKLMIFAKSNENIVITNVRTMAKESHEWQLLWDVMQEYIQMGSSAKESWENTFNETYPLTQKPKEEPKPAAKEQPKEAPKPAKKESKVKVPEKPKTVSKPAESVSNESEQLPGQDNIMNHPEYLPEDMKDDVLTGEVVDTENADNHNVQQAVETTEQQAEEIAPVQEAEMTMKDAWKRGIRNAIERMQLFYAEEKWEQLSGEATALVWQIKKLKALEEEN